MKRRKRVIAVMFGLGIALGIGLLCSCTATGNSGTQGVDERPFVAAEQEPADASENEILFVAANATRELILSAQSGIPSLDEVLDADISSNGETHQVYITLRVATDEVQKATETGDDAARLYALVFAHYLSVGEEYLETDDYETFSRNLSEIEITKDDIVITYDQLEGKLGTLYDTYDLTMRVDNGAGTLDLDAFKVAGADTKILWQ